MAQRISDNAVQPRSVLALWLTMLAPPSVWLTQFEIKYALAAHVQASRHGAAMVVVALLSLGIVAAFGVAAWGERTRAGASPLDAHAGVRARNRFMADVGIMTSVLFFLVIAAQFIADFFFVPGKS